jgi:hypothetical protein
MQLKIREIMEVAEGKIREIVEVAGAENQGKRGGKSGGCRGNNL